ncbi:MAG: DUF3043 domain-containing protein [Brachybacterium sp.]|nr:DUF3043 domain-containing protein [Brachybacterium sp.]MDN5899463.1 DUF3043 domain-containing protein [Brachybacterium sp.]
MIFRKSETPQSSEPEPQSARPGSKGRPTRTRKEAEAARRRPLVVDDRKEARRRDREKAGRERQESQRALMTGDEKKMPLQHRGPERSFVRDVVDSRWNIAEFFFPIALVFMVLSLVLPLIRPELTTTLTGGMIIVLWGGIAVCVIDGFVLRKRLRHLVTERFGEVQRGLVGYGIMRAVQIRRFRLPRAQIKHGQTPR